MFFLPLQVANANDWGVQLSSVGQQWVTSIVLNHTIARHKEEKEYF